MKPPELQSEAFELAALRSERTRIVGLLSVLGGLLLVLLARAVLMSDTTALWELTAILGSMAAYEGLMLRAVRKAILAGKDFHPRVWRFNVFVESLFPTAGLVALTTSPALVGPYRALTAPVVLTYFFFILLSTLRLRPILSIWTGLCSCGGYLAVTALTYWLYPEPEFAAGASALAIYLTYAVMLLMGGLLAAAVTSQIRVHVAAALREAELRAEVERLEHDLEIARSIQQGLLPSEPPELPGFALAGWNRPADQTGGDYFDWQELPNGRYAISLADVTGHGIGPALVAAVCRAYSRASFPGDANVNAAVERMDRLLADDLQDQRFVTLVVAILDPATAKLELLSAGHGPLLHYRAESDEIQDYDAQGIPLGLMPGIGYERPADISLAPGDMLVLTTDGFFEWENADGEDFGVERLKDVIRGSRDLAPAEVIERLQSAVTRFARGSAQNDDLTAVVLKRIPA